MGGSGLKGHIPIFGRKYRVFFIQKLKSGVPYIYVHSGDIFCGSGVDHRRGNVLIDHAHRAPRGYETSSKLQTWTHESESALWQLHDRGLWPAAPLFLFVLLVVRRGVHVAFDVQFQNVVESWKAYRSLYPSPHRTYPKSSATHPLLRSLWLCFTSGSCLRGTQYHMPWAIRTLV